MTERMTNDTSQNLSPSELLQKGVMKGFEYQDPSRRAMAREMERRIKTVVESFGFAEIEGPLLQPVEFYRVKSGDELLEHTYTFEDADGSLLVLRPELTPTVAYMVAKDDARLSFPLRWWSNPDLFRKEKPQRGRKRQFKQLNVDVFDRADSGRERAFDDAEVINVAISIFQAFGLNEQDVVMKINSRSLVEKVFDSISLDPDQRVKALTLIDRISKMPEDVFNKELEELISDASSRQVLSSWLSVKSIEEIGQRNEFSFLLETTEYKQLKEVFEILGIYGKSDYCEFSPQIVRGLGYYTGTVFEAFDRSEGFKRALMGGGRYDNLTKNLGGRIPVTGVGFGFGNVPLEEILTNKGKELVNSESPVDYYVIVQSKDDRYEAIKIAGMLREKGLRVVLDDSISKDKLDKVSKQFSAANKIKASKCLIIFPDELSRKEVVIKDMETGKQETINIESISN